MSVRQLFVITTLFFVQVSFAQKSEIAKLNNVFGKYNEKYQNYLVSTLSEKRINIRGVELIYQGYIWVKVDRNIVVFDSLLNPSNFDSTASISKVDTWGSDLLWAYDKGNWNLYDYTGKNQKLSTQDKKIISNSTTALLKKSMWYFYNRKGESSKVTATNLYTETGNENLILVQQGFTHWLLYDPIEDRLSDVKFKDFHLWKNNLLMKINDSWKWKKLTGLNGDEKNIPGQRLIYSGDTSSVFCVKDKKWSVYDFSNPEKPIYSDYDSIRFNIATNAVFGLKQGHWRIINSRVETELCKFQNDISYLVSASPKAFSNNYDSKVIEERIVDFYNSGLDPDKFNEFNLERGAKWHGESDEYLLVSKNGTGLCNITSNEFVILPYYKSIIAIGGGFYLSEILMDKLEGPANSGLLNSKGDIVIPFNYLYIEEVWLNNGQNRFFVAQLIDGIYDFFDYKGTKINANPVIDNDPYNQGIYTLTYDCGLLTIMFDDAIPEKQIRLVYKINDSGKYQIIK